MLVAFIDLVAQRNRMEFAITILQSISANKIDSEKLNNNNGKIVKKSLPGLRTACEEGSTKSEHSNISISYRPTIEDINVILGAVSTRSQLSNIGLLTPLMVAHTLKYDATSFLILFKK